MRADTIADSFATTGLAGKSPYLDGVQSYGENEIIVARKFSLQIWTKCWSPVFRVGGWTMGEGDSHKP